MNPDSALSAGQLSIMAVVVAASLAVWLIIVFLAARQPRGTSAGASARPLHGLPAGTGARPYVEDAAAPVTQPPSGIRPPAGRPDKAAA